MLTSAECSLVVTFMMTLALMVISILRGWVISIARQNIYLSFTYLSYGRDQEIKTQSHVLKVHKQLTLSPYESMFMY